MAKKTRSQNSHAWAPLMCVLMRTGTHTTPVAKYVDNISFTFSQNKGTCSIEGFSSADVSYFKFWDHSKSLIFFIDFTPKKSIVVASQFSDAKHNAIATKELDPPRTLHKYLHVMWFLYAVSTKLLSLHNEEKTELRVFRHKNSTFQLNYIHISVMSLMRHKVTRKIKIAVILKIIFRITR